MITLPAPSPLNGDLLRQELAAAGMQTRVVVDAGTLYLPGLGEPDRTNAEPVVSAHAATAQAAATQDATQQTNETSIRDKAAQALSANANDIATNDNFLAITSPTNAQVAAQVKELTRQSTRQAREINSLIRLALRRFDAAE